jgi:lipid A 4'-phosphatase
MFKDKEANKAYGWLLAASVLAALVPTPWSSLDLQLARYFFSPDTVDFDAWWWVVDLNLYTPAVFRGLLMVAAGMWLLSLLNTRWQRWRLPLAFVVLAGIAGPGLAVNGVVKPLWERARPIHVVEFGGSQQFSPVGVLAEECSTNCSFVSGHVACGFFLSSLCLLTRSRRALWMVAGTLAGAVIGFARVSALDHWLSDVMWAYPVTLLSSWLVWQALQRFSQRTGARL